MITTPMPEKIHQGRAVKRIREILQVKQETLADALGISQQSVSQLETKEEIDPETLELIAKTLKVPVEAIKNFNEEAAIYNIQNNYEGSNTHASNVITGTGNYHNCTFNPLDKYVEVVEKNEKLYEALLKSEREKNALLEKMLNAKK
jgi:transcriptional regulator with XRE-family HTH domain